MSKIECAAKFEQGESVKSYLPFGAEYDSALEWVIETGTRSLFDISENSASWGELQQYPRSCRDRKSGRLGCEQHL